MVPHTIAATDEREIPALTGIRGFAAILVVWGHFYASWVVLLPQMSCLRLLAGQGQLGVDLFFVLSGFILSYVYDAGGKPLDFARYRKFVWFRFARIYPLHLAMLATVVVVAVCERHAGLPAPGSYPAAALPFQLTMTHAWLVVQDSQWNYPSWSISAEWFAYLFMFPLTGWLLRWKLRPVGLLLAAYAALTAWVLLLLHFDGHSFWRYGALWRVSLEFLAGGALYGVYQRGPGITGWCQRNATWVFLALIGFLAVTPKDYQLLAAGGARFFVPLLLLGLTSRASALARTLSTRPALFLGRVSYAIYMSHAASERILDSVLPAHQFAESGLGVRLLVLGANLALIIGLATVCYYLVELPARDFLRRAVRKRVVQPPPAAGENAVA